MAQITDLLWGSKDKNNASVSSSQGGQTNFFLLLLFSSSQWSIIIIPTEHKRLCGLTLTVSSSSSFSFQNRHRERERESHCRVKCNSRGHFVCGRRRGERKGWVLLLLCVGVFAPLNNPPPPPTAIVQRATRVLRGRFEFWRLFFFKCNDFTLQVGSVPTAARGLALPPAVANRWSTWRSAICRGSVVNHRRLAGRRRAPPPIRSPRKATSCASGGNR